MPPDPSPASTVPRGLQVATAWSWRLLVIGGLIYVLLRLAGALQVLVVPLLVALLVVALVKPLADGLARTRLPLGAAALLTMVAVLALLSGLLTLVGTELASGFPELASQATAGLTEVERWLNGPPLNLTTSQLTQYLQTAQANLTGSQDGLLSGALAATATAGHVVTGTFIAIFATYFFLAQGNVIWAWVVRLLPRPAREPVDRAGRRGWVTLTAFVRATILVALADAIGIGIGAAALGVPLVVPLAVLVLLGAFVPIVGALVSGSVAVLVALVAQGPLTAVLMLAVVVVVQQLESHLLQPFLLGRAVRVHPLAVILSIATGALLAGVVGALFAVPVVAVGNAVFASLAGDDDAADPDAGPLAAHAPPPVDDERAPAG